MTLLNWKRNVQVSILGQKEWIILLCKKFYPEVSGPVFPDKLVCKANFVNIF